MSERYLKCNLVNQNNKEITFLKNKVTSNDELYVNKHLLVINKQEKRGIIYLSTIPKYMNVIKIREIFSVYGEVGRIYLQLAQSGILIFYFISIVL
jgi:hypothetical protein